MVDWARTHTCADESKLFATGFSNGGQMSNVLGCFAAELFKAVAPISGDFPLEMALPLCQPSRPISYISMCGSMDDEAHCQDTFQHTAQHWSNVMNCPNAPFLNQVSATSNCTQWSNCEGGNFVEVCESMGLGHDMSGHLRPDDT